MAFTLAEAVVKIFIPREDVRGELAGVEEEAKSSAGRVERTMTQAFSPSRIFGGFARSARHVRQSLRDVASALSGTAAIASLFAKQGSETQKTLQTVSLALSGVSVATRALGAVLRLLLANPLLLVVTALAVVIFAADDVKQAWERLRESTIKEWFKIRDTVVEVVGALVDVLQGFIGMWTNILMFRLGRAGEFADRLQRGLDRLKAIMPEVGETAKTLGKDVLKWIKDVFGVTARTMDEALQKALRLHDIETELNRLSLEQQIANLEKIRRLLADSAEERKDIDLRIFRLREQINQQELQGIRDAAAGARAQREEELARLQTDIDLVDLKREMGDATREEAIAVREALLNSELVVLTERQRLQLLKEIRDLRAQGDPMLGLTQAIRENLLVAVDWKEKWTNAIQGMQGSLEGAFASIRKGSRTVLEAAGDAITGMLDAVLAELDKLAANWLLRQILGGVFPGLGLKGGGVGGPFIPLAAGAWLKNAIVRAQRGFESRGPTLAALSEIPGLNEVVMPLPRGLRAEDLAQVMRQVGEGAPAGGDVNITYTGDMAFTSPEDMRSHARMVGDAVRLARRMNHPVIRGGEA